MRILLSDYLQSTALPFRIDPPASQADRYIDKYSEGPREQVPPLFAFRVFVVRGSSFVRKKTVHITDGRFL